MSRHRVLVIEGTSRKAVAVVRSLGRAGFDVTLMAGSVLAAARGSRFCARFVRCPSAARAPEVFWRFLQAHLRGAHYDILLPLEAEPLAAISPRRQDLAAGIAFPFAPDSVLRRAASKHEVMCLAVTLGISAPRSVLPASAVELDRAAEIVGFPAIVKPCEGQGSRGVKRVADREELAKWYPRIVARFGPALLQEFVPDGGEYGVSFLMGEGTRPLARFTHRRLRSYPVSGGPSTLRESVHCPEIEAAAERLLAAIGWTGVAMVEFRRDARDSSFRLIEINHRFWGSLPLAIAAGVDFPALLCRMALGEPIEPVLAHRAGVRCRWLFPGDLMHFLSNPERFRLQPSFFQFFARDLHYDIASLADPGPMALVLIETLANALSPAHWKRVTRRESH